MEITRPTLGREVAYDGFIGESMSLNFALSPTQLLPTLSASIA